MNPMWKYAYKLLSEDKQLKQMYKDFEKLEKDMKGAVKETEDLKKKLLQLEE